MQIVSLMRGRRRLHLALHAQLTSSFPATTIGRDCRHAVTTSPLRLIIEDADHSLSAFWQNQPDVELNYDGATLSVRFKASHVVLPPVSRARLAGRSIGGQADLPDDTGPLTIVFSLRADPNDLQGDPLAPKLGGCVFVASGASSTPPVNIGQIVAPEDLSRLQANVAALFNGAHGFAHEYRIRRKNGTTFPALVHTIPVVDDGKTIGLRGILVDLEARGDAPRSFPE